MYESKDTESAALGDCQFLVYMITGPSLNHLPKMNYLGLKTTQTRN